MAGRTYSLVISALAAASQTTVPFVQLAPPATCAIEIISFELYQETSETSQQEAISFTFRSTASTLPTSTTPAPLNYGDPASLLTGSTTTNATGAATVTGTSFALTHRFGFNMLNGLLWLPVPEARLIVPPSKFWTAQFVTTAASNTISGQVVFRELG